MTHQPTPIRTSDGLWQWLQDQRISLAFTTYQTNRLFLVGSKPEGRIAINERLFDRPMGLYACTHPDSNADASGERLVMSTRYAIWQLENRLASGETLQGCDRLYVPSHATTTGGVNAHDVVVDKNNAVLFINTAFSCLATLRPGYSFEPLWQPPFISTLKAEDRCHLNGLALQNGEATYVTACSATDEPAGWRHHRVDGGIVMHIPSNQIIATGLSMPHSPRWYRDKLWLLNSGTGEFGYLDGGQFCPVTFCPGFVRGLAFVGDYALVGLSKLRSTSFGGLVLEQRLAAAGQTAHCGLRIIDLNSGAIVQSLHFENTVEELFDVVVLPGVQQPRALGFQDDDIDRLINFHGSNGLIFTKPTVQHTGQSQPLHTPGLPRQMPTAQPVPPADTRQAPVKFQQVYHLTPDNLAPYDAMTHPSLQQRWPNQPPRGELIGTSASVEGAMVGLAIAEQITQAEPPARSELISLFVLPAHRHQGIATALVKHLQALLAAPFTAPTAAVTVEEKHHG